MDDSQMSALGEKIGFEYWEKAPDGRSVIRICTSWATTDVQVKTVTDALKTL